jgi:hypothetical protein
LQLHAFGPVAAAGLLWWSAQAMNQRRLVPMELRAWPFGLTGVLLVAYWLIRLWVSFGQGIWGFPGLPPLN